MVYFLRQGGIPEAIYSGRFTFVRKLKKKDASAFIKGESVTDEIHQILVHEETHKELFLVYETGLIILGYRLIARFKARVQSNRHGVEKYYKARAIYYRNMYDAHEGFVKHIESNATISDLSLDEVGQERMKNLDLSVLEEWRDIGLVFSPIEQYILKRLGKEYCRHFTLVAGEWINGKWMEENFTNSGIVNDRSQHRLNDTLFSRILKRSSKFAQVETWSKNDCVNDWEWMLIKFQEEYSDYLRHDGCKEEFYLYVHQAIAFSAQWCQSTSWRLSLDVAELVISTLDRKETLAPREDWVDLPEFRKMINLFYLHGN